MKTYKQFLEQLVSQAKLAADATAQLRQQRADEIAQQQQTAEEERQARAQKQKEEDTQNQIDRLQNQIEQLRKQ